MHNSPTNESNVISETQAKEEGMNPETLPIPSDDGSVKNECGEAPAVEGLLLLQHVSGTSDPMSLPMKRQMIIQETGDETLDDMTRETCTHANPVQELIRRGARMRVADPTAEFYRGVYAHPKHSLYYGIIHLQGHFYFLGFHFSALAAAQAWDLAAIKRSMDREQNLATAGTNYRLEDYVQLETVMSFMVVVSFQELVEMLADIHRNLGDIDEYVEETIQGCRHRIPEEIGNAHICNDQTAAAMTKMATSPSTTATSDCLSTVLTPESLHELISKTALPENKQSAWVRRIRDGKRWKGVYFSRDGVPYSKVEIDGECHYLGRFDTLEAAAKAYDLATLKRAMMNNQPVVSLNFSKDDYLKDKPLMDFLFSADSESVIQHIRKQAQNQKGAREHAQRMVGQMAPKRQRIETTIASNDGCRAQQFRESSVQHIDWGSLESGQRPLTRHLHQPPIHGSCSTKFQQPQARSQPLDAGDDGSESGRKQEVQVERRICDANMTALIRDSKDWVRVALNAVALRMTTNNIHVHANHAILPGDVAEWFGGAVENEDNEPRAVELVNACGKQSFHFVCYVAKDHCRFTAAVWNQFVDEIGLTSGDILVLLKSETRWKLSYAVFVLPDAVVPESFPFSRASRAVPGFPPGPAPLYVSSPPAIRPSVSPHMTARPPKQTLQAHVLPSARGLTGIQVIQKTRDGRLLVEACLVRDQTAGLQSDPGKRQLFVIPANSVQTTSLVRPPVSYINNSRGAAAHSQFQTPQNSSGRFPYGMTGAIPTPPSRVQQQQSPRPACLSSVPIHVNIRGGMKTLGNKTDPNLFMVTDSAGQTRLVTNQSMCHHSMAARGRTHQTMGYGQTVEGEPVVAYPSPYFSNNAQQSSIPRPAADRISRTTPEVTVIDPSTTGSDASGTNTEKPLHQVQQEEHSSGRHVIDLIDDDQKEKAEKHGDSLTDMYSHITKIIEDCTALDSDIAKKYKLAFANKMTPSQQMANYTELKNLSQAGKWGDVCEWVKSTAESF